MLKQVQQDRIDMPFAVAIMPFPRRHFWRLTVCP